MLHCASMAINWGFRNVPDSNCSMPMSLQITFFGPNVGSVWSAHPNGDQTRLTTALNSCHFLHWTRALELKANIPFRNWTLSRAIIEPICNHLNFLTLLWMKTFIKEEKAFPHPQYCKLRILLFTVKVMFGSWTGYLQEKITRQNR